MKISPSLLNDFIYCKNTIFFIYNDITKVINENIILGNIYENKNDKIRFGDFEIDKIDKKNKFIIELKKSKNHEGSTYQILFIFIKKCISKL